MSWRIACFIVLTAVLTACGGGSCIPFNFDTNDGGFKYSLDPRSVPGLGFPAGSQGWADER